jgi:hypothetical protein
MWQEYHIIKHITLVLLSRQGYHIKKGKVGSLSPWHLKCFRCRWLASGGGCVGPKWPLNVKHEHVMKHLLRAMEQGWHYTSSTTWSWRGWEDNIKTDVTSL